MKARLRAIARRRAALVAEIMQQRTSQHVIITALRQDLVFAGLGLVAGRLLVRRPWLRMLVPGALAALAARRVAARASSE